MWPGWRDAPVLVTGASGFVGAALVRRLAAEGVPVHGLVRPTSDLWRLESVVDLVTVHAVPLEDEATLADLCAEVRPEIVFHSAAYGGYAGQDDPRRTIETNLLGTLNLLEATAPLGLRSFVNLGSSSEYGTKAGPMREEEPGTPLTVYGISKAAATQACRATAHADGRRIVTLRLFSPYGPYEASSRLIPAVIGAWLRGEAPSVGSGEGVRDFVYIGDVVEACVRAPGVRWEPGEVVNIGSGRQASVREVVTLIGELLRATSAPRWGAVSARQAEPETWVADVTRAQTRLGWRATTRLADGLRATIAWMQERMPAHAAG